MQGRGVQVPDSRSAAERRRLPGRWMLFAVVVPTIVGACFYSLSAEEESGPGKIAFRNGKSQILEFMAYEQSIQLTAVQEETRRKALEPLPAPCCSDRSAYTCCCRCNMARAWWGLSKHLIADLDYSAIEVRETVSDWFRFINPRGFSGDTCYTGGCGRPFRENGCGGMTRSQLVY